ncbi:MAG TPA: glycosyltransferase [Candidatus Saccharimonadales bacterium]|nr:glycosyltransferase [Candidatus Saccharimonadales bacterium]
MKVAIVCDWLLGTGGAERVVLELHHLFPDAPIYTSQYDPSPSLWYGDKWFTDAKVKTTWLQRLPKGLKKFLPVLRAWTFSRLNLKDYDLVISASGAEAKFVKARKDAKHISYIHAPTHYYWSRYEEYLNNPGFGKLDSLARLGLRLLVSPMRRWDYKAAQRPDYLIANSSYTKEQIKKYYGRDSTVIHPPVEIDRFRDSNKPADERHGFVTAGRQTPYKRIDLAVKAATELNVPLIVIGNGPDHRRLKRMAGRSITFLTKVSDEEMPDKFGSAKAFIFPGIDDFGIVAVEAMAAGTPLIAYQIGGINDYISSNTGLLFENQTPESLAKAIEQFGLKSFDHKLVADRAGKFSAVNFRKNVSDYIKNLKL